MNDGMKTELLWRIVAEIQMPKDDARDGYNHGFMNVVTWATTSEQAVSKLKSYIQSFDWNLMSVDPVEQITSTDGFGDDLFEMVIRAEENKNAIILGTFHSYPTN